MGTNAVFSKITSKGQTTFPAEIRKALDLRPGDSVLYEINDAGEVVMTKVPPLSSFTGILKTEVRLTDEELQQAIEDARAAMARGDDWP